MNRDTPPARRSNPRCTLCNHPDRDDIDRDLALGSRTQVEIAKLVGIHPSTVSRHYRRHAQPRLAMTGGVDVGATPIGDLVTEHDRLYRITLGVLTQALARDDLRLARDMIAEIRKQLAGIAELHKAIEAGKIRDANARPEFDLEKARATFQKKLDNLAASYRRAPSIFEMIDALEAGADQKEIDRLTDQASPPPERPLPSDDAEPPN